MKKSKRLGVYSGRIYEAEDDYSRECCKVITEEQANDENWLADQRLINRFMCIDCSGCPMANGNNGGKYENPSYGRS